MPEITYLNGSMNGESKRVRSLSEQPAQKIFVWREFVGGKRTGRTRTETYRLDRSTGVYSLCRNRRKGSHG